MNYNKTLALTSLNQNAINNHSYYEYYL